MNDPHEQSGELQEDSAETSLSMFAFLAAAHALEERIERALDTVGSSLAKHGVLDSLRETGSAMSLGDLAERVSCVRSNMTQLIDRLQSEGLVERTSDPSDRRVVRAKLTSAGQLRAEAGAREIRIVENEFRTSLTDADCDVLVRLFEKLG